MTLYVSFIVTSKYEGIKFRWVWESTIEQNRSLMVVYIVYILYLCIIKLEEYGNSIKC